MDQSMALMQQAEALKVKKEALENPQFPGKEKVMDVCEICCNFMSNTDSEVRITRKLPRACKMRGFFLPLLRLKSDNS